MHRFKLTNPLNIHIGKPLIRMKPTIPLHSYASTSMEMNQVPMNDLIKIHQMLGEELGHELLHIEQGNSKL